MPFHFRDYFSLMRSRTPDAVISPAALAALDMACGAWPADACSFFGFERELRDGCEDAVDFLLCSFRTEQLAICPSRRLDRWAESQSTRAGDAWSRVAQFARGWLDNDSPLREVENIWLEFDACVAGGAELQPSLFFGPDPSATLQTMPELIRAALPILGGDESGEVTDAALRWIAALPQEAQAFHTGAMLARGVPGLRLCFRCLPVEAFVARLEQFGWAGDCGEFLETARKLQPWCDRFYFNIDCLPATGPKAGMEMHLDRQMKFEPRWTGLMEQLVRLGAADPAAASIFPQGNGYLHENMAGIPWPPVWRDASAKLEGKFLSTLIWFAHHVKLTFSPGQRATAKAYPGIVHRWLDRAALRKS